MTRVSSLGIGSGLDLLLLVEALENFVAFRWGARDWIAHAEASGS